MTSTRRLVVHGHNRPTPTDVGRRKGGEDRTVVGPVRDRYGVGLGLFRFLCVVCNRLGINDFQTPKEKWLQFWQECLVRLLLPSHTLVELTPVSTYISKKELWTLTNDPYQDKRCQKPYKRCLLFVPSHRVLIVLVWTDPSGWGTVA